MAIHMLTAQRIRLSLSLQAPFPLLSSPSLRDFRVSIVTRDSWKTAIVTLDAQQTRFWRFRMQKPEALMLQSVPPWGL